MGFESFKAYQAATLLRGEVQAIVRSLPPEMREEGGNMISQVERAIDTVLTNIAEGNATVYPGKRYFFFDVARASSVEARGGLRSLISRKILSYPSAGKAVSLTYVIPKLLPITPPE
jgi:four helix bundle protein